MDRNAVQPPDNSLTRNGTSANLQVSVGEKTWNRICCCILSCLFVTAGLMYHCL